MKLKNNVCSCIRRPGLNFKIDRLGVGEIGECIWFKTLLKKWRRGERYINACIAINNFMGEIRHYSGEVVGQD